MGKRRARAERAIDEVQERAKTAADTLLEGAEDKVGRAKRRVRKSRKGIDRTAHKAEQKLGRFWNRGRFRVRRLRRKAEKRIDRVAKSS